MSEIDRYREFEAALQARGSARRRHQRVPRSSPRRRSPPRRGRGHPCVRACARARWRVRGRGRRATRHSVDRADPRRRGGDRYVDTGRDSRRGRRLERPCGLGGCVLHRGATCGLRRGAGARSAAHLNAGTRARGACPPQPDRADRGRCHDGRGNRCHPGQRADALLAGPAVAGIALIVVLWGVSGHEKPRRGPQCRCSLAHRGPRPTRGRRHPRTRRAQPARTRHVCRCGSGVSTRRRRARHDQSGNAHRRDRSRGSDRLLRGVRPGSRIVDATGVRQRAESRAARSRVK